MRRRGSQTVAQVAIRNVGFIGSQRALAFCAAWWIVSADLGRAPANIEEYTAWWRQNERMSYREQATFRKAFPGYDSPTELATAIGFDFMKLKKGDESKVVIDLLGWSFA